MKKICFDAGHGGNDPGATADGHREKDITLDMASRLFALAEKQGGFQAVMTRTSDTHPSNAMRVKICNDFGADIFVAVHCNSAAGATAHGFEVIHAPGSARGRALAVSVAEALGKRTSLSPRNPPVKTDEELGRGPKFKLTVLRETHPPAILIEKGFLSNRSDRSYILNHADEIAQAIWEGILGFFTAESVGQGQVETASAEVIQPKPKEDITMTEAEKKEVAVKSGEALSTWDSLSAKVEGGTIDPKEVPNFIRGLVEFIGVISGILALFKTDPKLAVICGIVSKVLESIAAGIESQMGKITEAWTQIHSVAGDNKITVTEIPILLVGISNLVEAFITIALPFLAPEFSASAGALGVKIGKVAEWFNRLMLFSKAAPAAPKLKSSKAPKGQPPRIIPR